jgi:hypothetical protein
VAGRDALLNVGGRLVAGLWRKDGSARASTQARASGQFLCVIGPYGGASPLFYLDRQFFGLADIRAGRVRQQARRKRSPVLGPARSSCATPARLVSARNSIFFELTYRNMNLSARRQNK